MANTYFAQYIDDINRVIAEAIDKHDEASKALAWAHSRSEESKRDGSRDKQIVAAAQLREAEANYNSKVRNIELEVDMAFKAIRQELEKHSVRYTAADPDRVDQNAVSLLNSGVMSDADFVAMANKYWNNPTMLKLIAGAAEQNLTDSKTARFLAVKIAEFIAPDTRLGVFDDTVSIAKRAIQSDTAAAEIYKKMWDEQFYSEMRKAMDSLDTFSMEA